MIGKIFKKPTSEELLSELKSINFKESKVDSMLQYVNINHTNQNIQNFLHVIIAENKIESVKWLLKNKINFNAQDSKGMTALMLASKHGYLDAVEELLKVNADVNTESYNGYTAIEFAIVNHHFPIYKKLKPLIKDINRKNKKGKTLLQVAVKAQSFNVLEELFCDEKFEVNEDILFDKHIFTNKTILNTVLDKFDDLNKKDTANRNLLFYLVENGVESEEVFYSLLENGLDINSIDSDGNNILIHLIEFIVLKEKNLVINTPEDAEKHKIDMKNIINFIPIILENGIDPTLCNNKNETILSIPTKYKNLDILNILFEYDVDIDIVNKDNQTTLNEIIKKGNDYLEVIHLLLDFGASPNIKDKEGRTVIEKLIEASLVVRNEKKVKSTEKRFLDFNTDYVSILESVLVNTDANLTLYNSKEEPYIFEALRYGGIDIMKLLIKHGADINQPDNEGNNIIYRYMDENQNFKKESEQKEYYNNLQAIIIMGANVNAKDSFGGITLHKAILNCDITVIKMLLHSGADMNAIDNRGRHILHNAVWKNNIKIFKLIYTYNKSLLNEPDKFGVMPINYAAFLGYTDMVLEFIELNAHVNNPYKKTKYIYNFLKKFHKNLKPLIEQARTKSQKDKLAILVTNMRKEFQVEED